MLKENEGPMREGKTYWVRQVLNAIFIIAAVVGVALYLWGDRTVGLFVVMGAMVVKMAESTLRIFKL